MFSEIMRDGNNYHNSPNETSNIEIICLLYGWASIHAEFISLTKESIKLILNNDYAQILLFLDC